MWAQYADVNRMNRTTRRVLDIYFTVWIYFSVKRILYIMGGNMWWWSVYVIILCLLIIKQFHFVNFHIPPLIFSSTRIIFHRNVISPCEILTKHTHTFIKTKQKPKTNSRFRFPYWKQKMMVPPFLYVGEISIFNP